MLREYSEKLSAEVLELLRAKLNFLPPPSVQPKGLLGELRLPFGAAEHHGRFRSSVLAVGLSILDGDKSALQLQKELSLHRITVYRALEHLRDVGFTKSERGRWVLNGDKCPVLFWLTRRPNRPD